MRIAVDAMGGDHAPEQAVQGAILAAKENPDIEILLVGKEQAIQSYLSEELKNIHIVHCEEVIGTDEEPVKAVRQKKDSSLVRVTRMVKDGEVDACISAGNTGAYMTAGLLVAGRLKGIERPALTILLPNAKGKATVVLDVGANVDAKPEHLAQYALMGSIYAEKVLGYSSPTVGLLSVGTEEAKGNDLTKKAFPLIKATSVNFVGNVEGRDVPYGVVDVVVCDGFSGNVLLKVTEGVVGTIFSMLKKEFTSDFRSKIGALLLKPGLVKFKKQMDYSEYGGAPLLGLNGACIKAHGSSNAVAFKNAIGQAKRFIQLDVNERIKSDLQVNE